MSTYEITFIVIAALITRPVRLCAAKYFDDRLAATFAAMYFILALASVGTILVYLVVEIMQ